MSNEPRPRTQGQTTVAMLRKLSRNPTIPSPKKLTLSNVVDLGESSSNKPRRLKSRRKPKQVTIDKIFIDSVPESLSVSSASHTEEIANIDIEAEQEKLDQDKDMQSLSGDAGDDNQEQVAADSEEEEPELMEEDQEQVAADSEEEESELIEQDEETEFVYEELESRIESLWSQHQARVAATTSLRNLK